jgi:hypothetical protein
MLGFRTYFIWAAGVLGGYVSKAYNISHEWDWIAFFAVLASYVLACAIKSVHTN